MLVISAYRVSFVVDWWSDPPVTSHDCAFRVIEGLGTNFITNHCPVQQHYRMQNSGQSMVGRWTNPCLLSACVALCSIHRAPRACLLLPQRHHQLKSPLSTTPNKQTRSMNVEFHHQLTNLLPLSLSSPQPNSFFRILCLNL
jgi:hypothetical protein